MIPKIIWVQDFNTATHPGGAQLTNQYVIDWGKNLGFDIEECSIYTIDKLGKDPRYYLMEGDFYIMNNVVHLNKLYPFLIREIINYKKYIRYEHDYMWMHGTLYDPEMMRELFSKSLMNIYLSPLHHEVHQEKGLGRKDDTIMPSPIDEKVFRRMSHIERIPNTCIYTGGITNHKGIINVLNYARKHPEIRFDLVGWIEHPEVLENAPENVRVIPEIPHNRIAEVLNTYESFIHLPDWNEPFGRSVAEALLCGCKLIINEKIGFLSFMWNYRNREWLSSMLTNTPSSFWKTVNQVMLDNHVPAVVRRHW